MTPAITELRNVCMEFAVDLQELMDNTDKTQAVSKARGEAIRRLKPHMSVRKLAKFIGVTPKTVQYHLGWRRKVRWQDPKREIAA